MYRRGFFFAATLHVIRSQPTGCSDNAHCPTGFYCDSQQMFCQMCIQCRDFMREPPANVDCVTAVTDCGPCMKGFMEDKSSYLMKCIPPALLPAIPSYGWAIIIAALLVVGLLISIAVAFLLQNFKEYKLFSAIRTVEQRIEEDVVAEVELLPPPPYNTIAVTTQAQNKCEQDGAPPLIVPVAPSAETDRESVRYQTARAFSRPTYDCNDSTLPSYEIAALRESLEPVERNADDINMNNSANIPDHNQNIDTAMTRNRSRNSLNATKADSSEKTERTSRIRMDSNESENSGGTGGGSGESGAFFPQNLCIINVIRNQTSVQQHNTMISSCD